MTKNFKELWCKSKKTRQSVLELDVELRTIQLSNVRISFENRSPLFKLDTEIKKAADWFLIQLFVESTHLFLWRESTSFTKYPRWNNLVGEFVWLRWPLLFLFIYTIRIYDNHLLIKNNELIFASLSHNVMQWLFSWCMQYLKET